MWILFLQWLAEYTQLLKKRPYKRILVEPKEHVIHLITLRNGKIIAFLRKVYEPYYKYFNVYLYNYEDNYSSPQKIEFNNFNKYKFNLDFWFSFE